MSLYYPQGAVTLRIHWEDYGNTDNKILNDIYKLPVLARNIEVNINDYTEADTFSCEIDYKTFPFDPRTIRSVGVIIHMEDKKSIFKGNSLNKIEATDENIVFTGFADEESITFDDTTRVVRFEGRDFTALFIDAKYLGKPISLSQPLDKIIQFLIDDQKSTKKIEIENRTEEELPVLSKLAPTLDEKMAIKNIKKNESYWSIIQDLIERAGLIAFIELDKLIISKPQKIYNRVKSKQFIYGNNIKRLEYKRKIGRYKGFNIKVVSINLALKKLESVKIPEDATDENIKGPTVTIVQIDKDGNKIEPPKDAPFLTFRIPDISSRDHLIKVGEKIFEELGRQQIEGSLETFEMEVPELTGKVLKGKVLETIPVKFSTIRNGTPIVITLKQSDLDGIRTISTLGERKKFLLKRQYDPEVAEAFAQSMNKTSPLFYTKSVKFTINQDKGFKMKLDFINFIEIDNADMSV